MPLSEGAMPQIDTHDWDEFVKARNDLEAANDYHLMLIDKYTSSSTPIRGGQPISVTTSDAKAEIEDAEERLAIAQERMRRAQERVR